LPSLRCAGELVSYFQENLNSDQDAHRRDRSEILGLVAKFGVVYILEELASFEMERAQKCEERFEPTSSKMHFRNEEVLRAALRMLKSKAGRTR
jgi:hypothetical protein